MDELGQLYTNLNRLQASKRNLQSSIKELRQELGVKWTPAREYNNIESKFRNPDQYERLVQMENKLQQVLKQIRLTLEKIEDLEGIFIDDDED